MNDNALENFSKAFKSWGDNIGQPPVTSIHDVDDLADALVRTISDAIRTTGLCGKANRGFSGTMRAVRLSIGL